MQGFFDRLLDRLPASVGRRGRDTPDQLARDVVRLYEQGRYREARAVATQLVEIQRERLGEGHPDYASALNNLGLLLHHQGEYAEAEPLLRQALEVRKRVVGEHHPLYASSLNHLADLLQARGDLAKAEPLLREALAIRKESLGERHPDYATGQTGLALLLSRKGELADAEPLLREALSIRQETLGDQHPMTATAVSNLGLILQRRGNLAGAEPLLRRSLELRREALGLQHPDYAASLSHLASLLLAQNNPAGAEPLLKRSIEVRKISLGDNHPDVEADIRLLESIRQGRPSPPRREPETSTESRLFASPPMKAETAPVPDDPPSNTPPPLEPSAASRRTAELIRIDLQSLGAAFAWIGEALVQSGRRMQSDGTPLGRDLLMDLCSSQETFARLRVEALGRAEEYGLAGINGTSSPDGLPGLVALMDRAARVEEERPVRESALGRAIRAADRVLALRHRDPSQSAMLDPCRRLAGALKDEAARASPLVEIPPAVDPLAHGRHALNSLLSFIDADGDQDDQQWLALYHEVVNGFDRPLAAAAARKRLTTS